MSEEEHHEDVATTDEPGSAEQPKSRRRRLLTAGVGAAAAIAAGAVAIRKAASRGRPDPRSVVMLEPDETGWKITVAGRPEPHGRYETKKDGVAAARTLARDLAPSELVIHGRDGREQNRHEY